MTASRPRQVSAGRVPWGTRICISWTPGPQAHAWNTMSRVPDSGESQATLLRGNRNYAERNSWEICTFVYNEAFRCVVTVSGPASPTFPITPASMTLKVNFTQVLPEPRPPRSVLDTGAGVPFWHGIVSESVLIFALNLLLFLILSLHLHTCQHCLPMQGASSFMPPLDSHHHDLSSDSFILCVKPGRLVPHSHFF